MKTFGIVAAGLTLLVVGASAQPQTATRTLKITTGKVVTILRLPATFSPAEANPTVHSDSVRSHKDSIVLTGAARFQYGQAFTLLANEITVTTDGKKLSSLAAKGKVVIQVQADGKQVMQITADDALLEPGQAQ